MTTLPASTTRPRAIALMSGGLDSTLAAKLVSDQGVEVIGLHLTSPFACTHDVAKSAAQIGVPLLTREKGEAYLDLVKNPRYGYGSAMNPCIDCRIFMFTLADVVRRDEGADFIVTGEVLGQRPMSQQRESMALIDRKSPVEGLVLRPLSAQKFAPTIPEQRGWVDREKLLRLSGRGRKDQMALAATLGIVDYPTPAGGCLLTESRFASRLGDHFRHEADGTPTTIRLARSKLLRVGRHFRATEATKIILGRTETENREIESLWRDADGIFFKPEGFEGPSAVVLGRVGDEERQLTGSIMARYSRGDGERRVRVVAGEKSDTFVVERYLEETELEKLRL